MSYGGAIAQIAGWLTLGGVATLALVGFGIWLQERILIIAGIAVAASTFTYGLGVSHEKVTCDARFVAARARFDKDIEAATKTTNEKAEKLAGELADKEKLIDKWVSDYETLRAKKVDAACALTPDDLKWMR